MSVVKNTILARFEGGHVDVDQASAFGERVEEYLELANVRTREGAIGIALQRLRLLREDRRTLAVSGQVREAEQAYGIGFRLGDKMDGQMIASTAVQVDVNGYVTVTPEIDDPVLLAEQMLERRIGRIARGVPSEYAAPAWDEQAQGTGTDTTPPAFSQSDLSVAVSPAWVAPRPYWGSWLELTLDEPGTTGTRVQVLRLFEGGTHIVLGSCVLNPGDTRAVAVLNAGFGVGEKCVLYTQTVGTDAKGLTATLRGTMV